MREDSPTSTLYRVEGTYGPRRPERPADGSRPEPFPAHSVVWIREA